MRHADVPMPLLLLAAHQEGLASGAQCDDEGFGRHRRRRLVNAGRAARAAQGVIDLTPVAVEAGLAIRSGPDHDRRRAALLALLGCGPRAVSVGRCALALLGVEGLPRVVTPEVVLPGGSARAERDGIVVRRYRTAFPTIAYGGFRLAAPPWALAQAMSDLDRRHGVAVLDSALQRRVTTRADLESVAELARRRHGVARLRRLLPLADGGSQSPLESDARLQCIDAGIPPDGLQVPVRDSSGRVIAHGDLGWRLRRGRWLLVEIDGAGPHRTPQALFVDRSRQNAVVATGRVDMLRFTAADLSRRGLLPAAVRAHRAQDELRFRGAR